MHKMKSQTLEDRTLEGGIEWIVARELAPIQDELIRLRAYVEALHDAAQP
jgi:hypothetical protein